MGEIRIYAANCTGCRYCELACGFRKEKQCRPAVSRIRIRKEESEGREQPLICRQCSNPSCAAVCPGGALRRSESTGSVEYDSGRCTGCQACIAACPFKAVWYWPETGKILKCDRCGGDPACVRECPTGALVWER